MDMQIDFTRPELLSQYGVNVQQKLANLSGKILDDVRNKEAAEVGTLLNELMLTVRGINVSELSNPGPLRRAWNKILSEVSLFKGSFEKINDQMDLLVKSLEESKNKLLNDIKLLDETYNRNLESFHELENLIKTAEECIKKRTTELDQIEVRYLDYVALQRVKDQRSTLHEFEKRIHDLKLTRTMTLQTLPQIRLIQHNNNELVNKIQSSILNTIPIWKNQIILTLSLEKQRKIASIQKKISDTTNTLITKNSELLKENSINVAKLSEEGVVETKSLQKVNDDLISVVSGVLEIYHEGKAKRVEAEKELAEMERRLKATLSAV